MRFETEALPFGTYKIETRSGVLYLQTPRGINPQKISESQSEYLKKLESGQTIHGIIQEHIQGQKNISFCELFDLLEKLVKLDIVKTVALKRYFEEDDNESGNGPVLLRNLSTSTEKGGKWKKENLAKLPFFRNLQPDELAPFIAHTEIVEVPERSLIIKYGDTGRDLYALLEGEVSVYRIDQWNRRRLITIVPEGTVFGEGAFFFNKPRSADVISNVPCYLAKIKFVEKDFAPLLVQTRTDYLQQRFWVLHALLASPLFQNIPAESLDRFVIMGKTRALKSQEVLFKQAEFGDSFFVVIQGELSIERNNKLLKKLKQGDVFGEIALMINNGERMATARALTEGMVLEISRSEFLKTLAENLFLAKEIEEVALRRYNDLA